MLPLNLLINGIQAHLDQCHTLVTISRENVEESTNALTSLTYLNGKLDELCSKINTVEKVVDHIKINLTSLEEEIEKAEQKLGINNDNLVVNIFNPLFVSINSLFINCEMCLKIIQFSMFSRRKLWIRRMYLLICHNLIQVNILFLKYMMNKYECISNIEDLETYI